MNSFKKYMLVAGLSLTQLSLTQEDKGIELGGPKRNSNPQAFINSQVFVTVDNKLACPAGFEVSWRQQGGHGDNLLSNRQRFGVNATPLCKLSNSTNASNNVMYWAALLNDNKRQSEFTKELVRASQRSETYIGVAGPKAVYNLEDGEFRNRLIIDEAIQATEALKEFRRGLVSELDNFSATGLKHGNFDQKSLSILKGKINQWNSDIQGTDFAPIYVCSSYGISE